MKNVLLSILSLLILAIVIIGISYASGWVGVHQKSTIGKAYQNADREVFEQSQSYVEGKRQESAKLYKEYMLAKDPADKAVICEVVSHTFANFELGLLRDGQLSFVYNCMSP